MCVYAECFWLHIKQGMSLKRKATSSVCIKHLLINFARDVVMYPRKPLVECRVSCIIHASEQGASIGHYLKLLTQDVYIEQDYNIGLSSYC